MFLDEPSVSDRINACKVDAHLLVGKNKEKHFFCNFCDKSFNNKTPFNNHIRTHTGECPYQCNLCDKSFTQNRSLKAYLIIHTGGM